MDTDSNLQAEEVNPKRPLYSLVQGCQIGKTGRALTIRRRGTALSETPITEISSLCIYGNAQISAQAIAALMDDRIPIFHYSYGGWLRGVTQAHHDEGISRRIDQFRVANDPEQCMEFGKSVIDAKMRSCLALLRRNHDNLHPLVVEQFNEMRAEVRGASATRTIWQLNRQAATLHRTHFTALARIPVPDIPPEAGEHRPRQPIEATLSFAYSVLTRHVMTNLMGMGFDIYRGLYNNSGGGRPALAMDVAEEFRPLIADSAVLMALNRGEMAEDDYGVRQREAYLTETGRTKIVNSMERRLNATVKHPNFENAVSYRRVLEAQARALADFISGESNTYKSFYR